MYQVSMRIFCGYPEAPSCAMAWTSPIAIEVGVPRFRNGIVYGALPPSAAQLMATERVTSQRKAMATRSEKAWVEAWYSVGAPGSTGMHVVLVVAVRLVSICRIESRCAAIFA